MYAKGVCTEASVPQYKPKGLSIIFLDWRKLRLKMSWKGLAPLGAILMGHVMTDYVELKLHVYRAEEDFMQVFYAACQGLLYVLCYRLEQLVTPQSSIAAEIQALFKHTIPVLLQSK